MTHASPSFHTCSQRQPNRKPLNAQISSITNTTRTYTISVGSSSYDLELSRLTLGDIESSPYQQGEEFHLANEELFHFSFQKI